jgi:hypothetical protein
MILLDKPFVSDFLIKTIRDQHYPLIATKEARELVQDTSLHWIPEMEARRIIKENPGTPLYSNSENALAWVDEHLQGSAFAKHAQLFKDKLRFRELIKDSYPDFQFRTVLLTDIQGLDPKDLPFPFVIKPSVGFFSIGVHVVKDKSDWEVARKELSFDKLKSIYPSNVLNTSTFIIEEFIHGEEFAVDCYYNQLGEVVILNILHHRFSSGADTSDRVYTTSRDLVHAHMESFRGFLQRIGRQAGLQNFPAHVELRLDSEGTINPIEINPLRFGGWCTTADLLGISTGFSPYGFYLENKVPDWDEVFKDKENKIFSLIVLNNNSGYAPDQIRSFDYDLLEKDFEHPLVIRKMDASKYSVFGFVFAESRVENVKELDSILTSDLRKYISLL